MEPYSEVPMEKLRETDPNKRKDVRHWGGDEG
jgi:hypothetical protein